MKRFIEIVAWWQANGIGFSKEQLWRSVHNDLMIEVWDELDEFYAKQDVIKLMGQ
jgi:hypothetical protein